MTSAPSAEHADLVLLLCVRDTWQDLIDEHQKLIDVFRELKDKTIEKKIRAAQAPSPEPISPELIEPIEPTHTKRKTQASERVPSRKPEICIRCDQEVTIWGQTFLGPCCTDCLKPKKQKKKMIDEVNYEV